jgi:hypothetical protein
MQTVIASIHETVGQSAWPSSQGVSTPNPTFSRYLTNPASLKPFIPLILTFVIPRVFSYYRTVRTAIRTRPPARPLPSKTSRGLNVLFFSICLFLFWTIPFGSAASDQNIFVATNARLHAPSDVLFSRLAMIRPNRRLTPLDEELRCKITTPKYVVRSWLLLFADSSLACDRYIYASVLERCWTVLSAFRRMTPRTFCTIFPQTSCCRIWSICSDLVWQLPKA